MESAAGQVFRTRTRWCDESGTATMSAVPNPVELSARVLVYAARAAAARRVAVAGLGLVVTLLVALGYVMVGALHINPMRSTITVRVLLPESGGLLANQNVTLRGNVIGRVKSVDFTDTGVVAIAEIDGALRLPQNSTARVSALSAAGEQYLDFRPGSDRAHALPDGGVLQESQTAIPVSLGRLLSDADGALAQLNPEQLAAVTDELRVSHLGPEKLAALLDGGSYLVSTLEAVLPQTVSIIQSSRTVFTTLADSSAGLRVSADKLHSILQGMNAMDGGFRTLVDRGSAPLKSIDNIVSDNSDTMVQLLGNLTTIAQLSYLRVPALQALFPTTRGSAVDAVGSVVRDGGIWAIVDLYPRYSCDYKLPRRPPSLPDFPEPFRYTYCGNPDPAVLVRGARNAPRPPGDDTAEPPPGYDPLAQTDTTPVGPNSIPTLFGGPLLPMEPPR
ncbi:MlaD family protein [Mycobacteroides chelonae]|uniref:MlaD family protein n=1 Tax=Mycobacteroides chelonae TaxID=1774 RepID=UPI002E113168